MKAAKANRASKGGKQRVELLIDKQKSSAGRTTVYRSLALQVAQPHVVAVVLRRRMRLLRVQQ